ncbi:hypothetical protein KFK09_007771 [Dendrobium nobile]|uniref:Uncharacterized protein n=1 Tax=Dendrobium nobile TaxID=94219 RepID=A0A8T3BV86_DENNO|nr:hypothetical protein KFK09_007771 [Dendrobium nobile]
MPPTSLGYVVTSSSSEPDAAGELGGSSEGSSAPLMGPKKNLIHYIRKILMIIGRELFSERVQN